MNPGMIVFDCDGVLVDSEMIAIRVLLDTIAAQGVVLEPEHAYSHFLGRSLATVTQSLLTSHGLKLGPDALAGMQVALFARYRRELRAVPGVAELLDELKIPFCVASSSLVERIRLSLEVTSLLDRFEPHIFSATTVARGKPAPDLFLHAASEMGVMPKHCLVVEDSPMGILAAQAAGMRVAAFVGGLHVAASGLRTAIDSLRPNAVIDDIRQVRELLLMWGAPSEPNAGPEPARQ